jgi:hypothetical protein
MLEKPFHPLVVDGVEEASDVGVEHIVHLPFHDPHVQRVQRVVAATSRAEPVAEPEEILLVNLLQDQAYSPLDDLVLQSRDPQRSLATVRFLRPCPLRRLRSVGAAVEPLVEVDQAVFESLRVRSPRYPIDARTCFVLQLVKTESQQPDVDVVQQRGEPHLLITLRYLSYAVEAGRPAFPTLRSARGLPFRIPLDRSPSLHGLRRSRRLV